MCWHTWTLWAVAHFSANKPCSDAGVQAWHIPAPFPEHARAVQDMQDNNWRAAGVCSLHPTAEECP